LKGPRVTRADLDHLKPGFEGYFEKWFKDQEDLWREEGVTKSEADRFYGTLAVLAFALGPLQGSDILVLMERINGPTGIVPISRLLDPWRRFVFGGGEAEAGYVLSHPKLGDYLQTSRFSEFAKMLRQKFAEWGKAHAADLNARRLKAVSASPYCLQFLPEHLTLANTPPEDFMIMVQNGWRLAWEKFEGGQRGFANAVQTAFTAQKGDKTNLRLGARWRCALTLSSIKNLGQNVPAEVALAAVDKGILTIRQAAYFAELKGPSSEAVRLLMGLAVAA